MMEELMKEKLCCLMLISGYHHSITQLYRGRVHMTGVMQAEHDYNYQ